MIDENVKIERLNNLLKDVSYLVVLGPKSKAFPMAARKLFIVQLGHFQCCVRYFHTNRMLVYAMRRRGGLKFGIDPVMEQ